MRVGFIELRVSLVKFVAHRAEASAAGSLVVSGAARSHQ